MKKLNHKVKYLVYFLLVAVFLISLRYIVLKSNKDKMDEMYKYVSGSDYFYDNCYSYLEKIDGIDSFLDGGNSEVLRKKDDLTISELETMKVTSVKTICEDLKDLTDKEVPYIIEGYDEYSKEQRFQKSVLRK